MLYKEIPFLRFCPPLATGILAGKLISAGLVQNIYAPYYLLLSLLIFIIIRYIRDKSSYLSDKFGILITIFFFITGLTAYNIKFRKNSSALPSGKHTYVVRVTDYPSERKSTIKVPVKIIKIDNIKSNSHNKKLLIYFIKSAECNTIKPGDIISVNLEPLRIVDFDTTDNFDYSTYMLTRGYNYYAFAKTCLKTETRYRRFTGQSLIIRSKLLAVIEKNIGQEENFALVSALVLGQKQMLGPEIKEEFSRAGIMHILAVSGLHVGIVSILIMTLLKVLRIRSRRMQITILLVVLWSYAILTGLGPSVVRAALMFSFLHTGKLIKRSANSINSLLASAFLMLVINPLYLFDAGFLLSYSAVFYILAYYKDLYNLFNISNPVLERIWALTVVSILAQLGTFPFIIFFFGRIPVLSLVSSLYAIPLAFIIITTAILLLLTSPIPVLPLLIGKILFLETKILISLAGAVSSLPFSVFETPHATVYKLFILIITLPVITSYLLKDEKVHPHLAFISLVLILL